MREFVFWYKFITIKNISQADYDELLGVSVTPEPSATPKPTTKPTPKPTAAPKTTKKP